MNVFQIIGMMTCGAIALAACGYAMLWAYYTLLHNRWHVIFFRKGQRRLSLVSWHQSRLIRDPDDDKRHDGDDWVINEHPFYLSYRIGEKRLFLMAGYMAGPRLSVLKGKHP